MLHTAIINGTDLQNEYGLILMSDVTVNAPSVKRNTVSVPGSDGVIDLSTYPAGRPTYNNRNVSFNLFKRAEDTELQQIRSSLMNRYHGQTVKVVLPMDTEHYFKGVLSVGNLSGYNRGRIPVTLDAEPWKYKLSETVYTDTLTSTAKELHVFNEYRPVIPVITLSNEATLVLNGESYTLSAGVHRVIDFVLQSGDNSITATGNGSIEIKYQEATF